MNPPPIPLEPGETVVLSGARGWHFWLWTGVFVPMLCALLPLAVIPFLISGRYWLTQRRLIFKSPLGQPKSLRLADITGIELNAPRATLTVTTGRESITIRFAQHFARLAGAIQLMNELPVPEQGGAPQVKFVTSAATAKFPGGWQQGYAVNFNRSVVFLPNERARNTAAEAGKLAGQLALALVGVHVHRNQVQLPFDLWLSLWSHLSTDEFDALLRSTAEARGGRVIALEQLEVVSPQKFTTGDWTVSSKAALFS